MDGLAATVNPTSMAMTKLTMVVNKKKLNFSSPSFSCSSPTDQYKIAEKAHPAATSVGISVSTRATPR